jgi:hypothetical protein
MASIETAMATLDLKDGDMLFVAADAVDISALSNTELPNGPRDIVVVPVRNQRGESVRDCIYRERGSALAEIAAERERQVSGENWTPSHDDEHADGELAMAAACYAAPVPIRAEMSVCRDCGCREAGCAHQTFPSKGEWRDPWPFEASADKRQKHDRIRCLTIAAALIAAEIDRLRRLEAKQR